MTRRQTLRQLAAWTAVSPLLRAQEPAPRAPEPALRAPEPALRAMEPALEKMINIFDFEPVCKANVPKASYDYVSGGAWDEWTVKRNRDAFGGISFRPDMLNKVDQLDLSTELFGKKLSMPVMVAPTGTHILVHPDAEIATAKGAGAAGAVMVVSTSSSVPLAKIAEAATGPLWFQLYSGPDKEGTRERVENAVSLGCQAVCWTVDAPYDAPRERDFRNNLERVEGRRRVRERDRASQEKGPFGITPRFQAQLTWSYLPELVRISKVPVLVKGILTASDAKRAVAGGAAGIIVSNHGGRFLDGAPSTIEMLPEIVDAVGAKVPVLIDSGFRRGTDILKALAIGAKAVLVGRPPLWGLGAFGEPGVRRVMEILRTELAWAMGLAGRPAIKSINRSLIRIEK